MGREIKRVALDFDWPVGCVWPGYMLGICTDDIKYCVRTKQGDKSKHHLNDNCDVCKHFARLAGMGDGCPDFKIHPPEGEGWQLWETVSEGSPITPVYATVEELIDHMCRPMPAGKNLPWDTGWTREVAEQWVTGAGWAPSMIMCSSPSGMRIMDGVTGIVEGCDK